jgi:predicted Co/Zn/Cd cation transporter (cation efflux family)
MKIERFMRLRSELEARLLRLSVAATLVIAGLGVLLGLWARSPAVIFDGLFALIDAAITWLTLQVAVALAIQGTAAEGLIRFIDPLALALITLLLLPMPFREARESFAEILQISPARAWQGRRKDINCICRNSPQEPHHERIHSHR